MNIPSFTHYLIVYFVAWFPLPQLRPANLVEAVFMCKLIIGLSITTEVGTMRETLVVIQAVNWLSAGWQTANSSGRALAVRCDWLLVQQGDSQ